MISEKDLTDKEEIALSKLDLTVEMAVASEWIIRDNADPDSLLYVYVAPTDVENELQAACACRDGAQDRPCPHVLAVFREIRERPHILDQILKRQPPAPAAA